MPSAKVGATTSVANGHGEAQGRQGAEASHGGSDGETCAQRTARVTRTILNWTPIVFVTGILIYGYYVYVIEYCCKGRGDMGMRLTSQWPCVVLTLLEYDPPQTVKAVLYLVTIHVLVLLFGVSYVRTIFQSPGSPLDFDLQVRRREEGGQPCLSPLLGHVDC